LEQIDISSAESFRAYFKNDPEIESISANYDRNRLLIDLNYIPHRFFPIFHKTLRQARQAAEIAAKNATEYLNEIGLLKKYQSIDAPR
jgi:hypothetical protein